MSYESRIRQLMQQQARAARMIQVDVCHDHVVDVVALETECLERSEQARHGMVGSSVYECAAAVCYQQITRIEAVADEAGVDHADAVIERLEEVMSWMRP